jgi:hypothetical protein
MAALTNHPASGTETPPDDDRRKFLATCGQFAVVTPPALTVLLSTSLNSEAIAKSGGRGDGDRGDRGHGDRDHDRDGGRRDRD